MTDSQTLEQTPSPFNVPSIEDPKELPFEIFDRVSFWLNEISTKYQPNSTPKNSDPMFSMADKLMFEAPLIEEILASIKQKFPNYSNENDVCHHIRTWQPASFSEIRNGIHGEIYPNITEPF